MTKKQKLIYDIVKIMTLTLPLGVLLLLNAITLRVTPDYTIVGDFTHDNEYVYGADVLIGKVVLLDNGEYGALLVDGDVLLVDKKFYTYTDNELVKLKKFGIEKEQTWKLPISFFIIIIGVVVAVLVIFDKMGYFKKYKRLAVWLSLFIGTIILFIIDLFVSNILYVFVVALASWSLYIVEYLIVKNKLSDFEEKNVKSDLLRKLGQAIDTI